MRTIDMGGEGDCTTCGTHELFRDTAGQCHECHNAQAREYIARRKAQLEAMPRCEFCNRRATYIAVGSVQLCGRHLKEATAKAQGFGIFGMMFDMNPAAVRSLLGAP
ncbi:MAG: hypothetical protein Q7O66_07235 [Dehalococcoidia bacterium]|nr:hypothetical protein [Dehalococcoidia bacterium]